MAGTGDEGAVREEVRDEEVARLERRVEALERQIAGMFDENGAVKLLIDPANGAIVAANPAAARFYGYSVEELAQLKVTDLNRLPPELVQRELDRAREEQRSYFEFKHRLKDGSLRDMQVYSGPIEVDGRTLLFSVLFDITERKRLAEELAHAQRMESLGRLAGGVAHDFNNLLTTVELLRSVMERKLGRGADPASELADLKETVARGAALTSQLLTFCRRQPVSPVLIDLREVVRDMERMIRRVLTDRIQLVLDLPRPAPLISDRNQLEHILLNLALNATDAMQSGGVLTISVDHELLDGGSAARLEMEPGPGVVLRVRDTGGGIEPELRGRVFEPFFTTKPPGEGTGLGLATVYGVARQWRGAIELDSDPGRGTTFALHWPLAPAEPPPPALAPTGAVRAEILGGSETILLAEDDETSRRTMRQLLEDAGYRVLDAGHGRAALERARAHQGTIHLLVTDVIMPVMGGVELCRQLSRERPDVRVLYMSGFVDVPGVDLGLLDASERLLAKPFALEDLLAMVRAVLDGAPRRMVR